MRTKAKLFLVLLVSVAALFSFFSRTPSRHIDTYLKENDFRGTVLISKKGKIFFKKAYGLANEEDNVSSTPTTIFRIGSITKQFTAVAILQLQEKGLVDVQDSVSKYLPDYPDGGKITLHQLLCHSSGIPSITKLSNFSEIQCLPLKPEQTLAFFNELPLRFIPGTDCEYSDSGYLVLGAIIEKVSGKKYEAYLQDNIFRPLGMKSTFCDSSHLIIPNRAQGYVKKEGTLQHADYMNMSLPQAAGGLCSTVEDLHKWASALEGTQLLTQVSLDSLFTIHASNTARKIAYGYGFRIGAHNLGMEGCRDSIVGHFGTINGFKAAFIRYLDDGLTLILLSNLEDASVQTIHKDLAQIACSSWR